MLEVEVPIVYDAGALLAAESGDRRVWALHRSVTDDPIVTSPVVAQVWRNGARQALLARFLGTCRVDSPTEEIARFAGTLLGRAGASDAIDALVVATALAIRAPLIVTSDPTDLARLCEVAGAALTPTLYRV